MGRSHYLYWGLIVSLCVASGCGTVGRRNPVAWFQGRNPQRKAADEKLAAGNPFRKNDPTAAADRQAGEGRTRQLDFETKQHIAEELADATPAEREQLTADFESLDPLVIRQILKLRRMRIELEQEKEKQSLASTSSRTANEPYRGLGAAYPGRGQRSAALDESSPLMLAAADDETAADRTGLAFGHSQSFGGSGAADARRAFGPAGGLEQSPAGLRADAAARGESPGDTPPRSGFDTVSFNRPEADRPIISPNRPVPSEAAQQSPAGEAPPRADGAVAATGVGDSGGNPLTLMGIDTSPVRPSQSAAMPSAAQQADPSFRQWRDALLRMIAVAEEQAYAAQTAWEEAEQLTADREEDEGIRRELIAARRQGFVEKQVHLRLLYLMSGQQARALERIRGLEPADQEFWTQVMWSLANYFDAEGMPNRDDRATQTIIQLRTAIQHLQETAKLEIRNVDFCRKISSFGNYEPFENDLFRPGQPVMVYSEIENFTSERGSDGIYRTQLKSTIEIHKVSPAGSNVIETIEFDATTDLCRNHRRDYYHSYELQIPAKATSGSYALVLIVSDQLSERVATYSRNFTVE